MTANEDKVLIRASRLSRIYVVVGMAVLIGGLYRISPTLALIIGGTLLLLIGIAVSSVISKAKQAVAEIDTMDAKLAEAKRRVDEVVERAAKRAAS